MLRCLTFSKVSTNNKEGPAGLQDRVRTSGHIWEWRKETVTSDLVVADPSEHTQNLVGGWNKTTQRDHLFRRDVDLELILRGGLERTLVDLCYLQLDHISVSPSQLQSEVEKPLLAFRENFKKDMKRFDHHISDLRKQLVGRCAAVEKVPTPTVAWFFRRTLVVWSLIFDLVLVSTPGS